MKKMHILEYVKKWLPLIILFLVTMTGVSYLYLNGKQTYTASVVIQYQNKDAKDGLAPDGSEIDVSDIYSSSNMGKVMENLGLSYDDYSLDKLCASISVTAVEEEQTENIKEAVNKEGEEYTVKPTKYIVKCTLGNEYSVQFCRNLLNELLDVYFSEYSSKHINVEEIHNETRELVSTDYEYLEMVENIDQRISQTVGALSTRYLDNKAFRSETSGYSFADLSDKFAFLNRVNVSRLYAIVLGNRIAKDTSVLVDKYSNRIEEYALESKQSKENIDDILKVIDAYVQKMRSSGNTDIDYNYILSDVYDDMRELDTKHKDRTVQYDTLLRYWIKTKNNWNYSDIQTAYCKYVIGVYQNGAMALNEETGMVQPSESGAGGESTAEELPLAAVSSQQGGIDAQTVEDILNETIDEMNRLYKLVAVTNEEYNEYLGAKNICILSSISSYEKLNLKLYMTAIATFFLVIGCFIAVVLGRLGDILEYAFLIDKSTGCRNRQSCDRYIEDHVGMLIPLTKCCFNIQLVNTGEMNKLYGREKADKILKDFSKNLRQLFEPRKNSFVGYNGSGQFCIFYDKDEQLPIEQDLKRLIAVMKESFGDVKVVYDVGAVNAGESVLFKIRSLISAAAIAKQRQTTNE